MLLVKPSYEILTKTNGMDILGRIEAAGRTCYKSEEKITSISAIQFVERIIKSKHHSQIEHESISVRFIIDRGVSHELVRHRLCAFSQESTRYCDYAGGHITFVVPPWVEQGQPEEFMTTRIKGFGPVIEWKNGLLDTEYRYKALRNFGWTPQQARAVLPNSLKTEIIVTANLREWRHIFKLRCARAAHPQMREIMQPLLAEMQDRIPVIFDHVMEEEDNE